MDMIKTKTNSDLREDVEDFKYNLENLHAIVKDDNPWENESDMIKELAIDRRKRYNKNNSMKGKKVIKNLILIIIFTISMLNLSSCNRYEPMEAIGAKNVKNGYVINTRSGKVHTYSHGIKVIENKNYIKETDDDLENILKDEKYDICHTCYAGLLVNNNIKKYDIDLIEKYMRLYDFVKIAPDRAEFLMSIFTVGDWYVNNVYTYQGGIDSVSTIETNAKVYASKNAYSRWENYKTSYSKNFKIDNSKKILPVVYDGNKNPTNLALYICDLFKGKYAHGNTEYTKNGKVDMFTYDKERLGSGYKNDYVVDDCSKFAVAVYYHYINNTILKNKSNNEKDGMGIDLWTTGSKSFDNAYSGIGKILLKTKRFEIDNLVEINKKKLEVEVGDMIYRKEKAHYEMINGKKKLITDIPGHVEFYIGDGKYVGWGKVQKENTIKKIFIKKENGFYSDYQNDHDQPYVTLIKIKGGMEK